MNRSRDAAREPDYRPKYVHLTSVHLRYDTRIFLKQCRSLVMAGFYVALVVADGKGDEMRDGVEICDVGSSTSRLDRMLGVTRRVYRKALELDALIYHLHDPELLPIGLLLKRAGKTVVFDAHEDLPRQILSKPYLHPVFRKPLSWAVEVFERFAAKRLDHIVAATPTIRNKFAQMGAKATDINNFPILGELESALSAQEKDNSVCYVGGISRSRGIQCAVEAIDLTKSDAHLILAGQFIEGDLERELALHAGWRNVTYLGFLDRPGVKKVYSEACAGLVTLHPTLAYLDSLPVKMFEYMSAGVPVIASNFPLWREIIEGNECGICVNPLDPAAIAAAIDELVNDPQLAKQMGQNGRRAVYERYNWGVEEKKLLALYEQLA